MAEIFDLIIKGGDVWTRDGLRQVDIAINSGKTWPKDGNVSPNKTLIVSILKPIEPGMESKEFLNCLQSNIYSELDIIN